VDVDDDAKDSTLITTVSGNKFAKNPGDWKWWNVCVPAKLKDLNAQGYASLSF